MMGIRHFLDVTQLKKFIATRTSSHYKEFIAVTYKDKVSLVKDKLYYTMFKLHPARCFPFLFPSSFLQSFFSWDIAP